MQTILQNLILKVSKLCEIVIKNGALLIAPTYISIVYRVDHMFPPNINYQIPRNVCTVTKYIFGWNIVVDVVYNGIRQIFNKTSPSLYNELKFIERDRSFSTHLFLREMVSKMWYYCVLEESDRDESEKICLTTRVHCNVITF